jgi:hypothetical protein
MAGVDSGAPTYITIWGGNFSRGNYCNQPTGSTSCGLFIVKEATVNVSVDIKPGSDPNSINLCSGGAVPVAIFGSVEFDVLDVNTETLRFADADVKVVGKKDRSLCSYEDVNGDGETDLVCHYATQDIAALDGTSSAATINGSLHDGTAIAGTDGVIIVKDTCH